MKGGSHWRLILPRLLRLGTIARLAQVSCGLALRANKFSRPSSFDEAMRELVGGSPYELKQAAIVDGQHYAQIPLRPRPIKFWVVSNPLSLERQKNFDLRQAGTGAESFTILADSYQTYYAAMYSRSASETVSNFLTGALLEGSGLGFLRESKWQGLGDFNIAGIPEEKGKDLMAHFTAQAPAMSEFRQDCGDTPTDSSN